MLRFLLFCAEEFALIFGSQWAGRKIHDALCGKPLDEATKQKNLNYGRYQPSEEVKRFMYEHRDRSKDLK